MRLETLAWTFQCSVWFPYAGLNKLRKNLRKLQIRFFLGDVFFAAVILGPWGPWAMGQLGFWAHWPISLSAPRKLIYVVGGSVGRGAAFSPRKTIYVGKTLAIQLARRSPFWRLSRNNIQTLFSHAETPEGSADDGKRFIGVLQ